VGALLDNFFEQLGIKVLAFFEYIGGLIFLLFDTLGWIARGVWQLRLTVYQMAFLGVNSSAIVILTTGFTGMVISLDLIEIAARYGVANMAGAGVGLSMAREFAPMLTAVVIAGRAGSAITAEIGSMKVTEQIDALYAMAVSPVKYLVVPRVLACLAMFPLLTLFSNFSGDFGGWWVSNLLINMSPKIYIDSMQNLVQMSDIWGGLIKSLVFALEVSLIACYQGLRTEGGAAGVGKATTGSVVYSILVIFVTNYFLSAWLFR
jgi:phospholipid/cholesterol/gamma-HCH transport system permease protein